MAKESYIHLKGVRVNNLKNLNLKIPIGKITCFAGPSGSGKTSLAFHTLLAESKRRLMNCYPNNLSFFSSKPSSVEVDKLSPVLPVFGLQQINPVKGARATVSDSLGMTHLIQSLFYQMAHEYCPKHSVELKSCSLAEQFSKKTKLKDDEKIHFFISKKDFIEKVGRSILPPRSCDVDGDIHSFDVQDPFFEILRIKGKSISKLDSLGYEIETLYYSKEGKKLKSFKVISNKTCPKCDFEGQLFKSENFFSPFNALGACSACKGFGATLEITKRKLADFDKSINEGGVTLFRLKRYEPLEVKFIKAAKKKKISISKNISDLGDDFWELLYKGSGDWVGFDKIEAYLNRKRYKPGVRVILRKLQVEVNCEKCEMVRIENTYFHYKVAGSTIKDFHNYSLDECLKKIGTLKGQSNSSKLIIKRVQTILKTAVDIGLGHLLLLRKSKSLSAGEYQRIQLVKFLSFDGTGSLFVFDEPSIGLDETQQKKLIEGLKAIKAQGNTVVVVEHSEIIKKSADHLILLGPGAGPLGGEITHVGKYKPVRKFKAKKVEKNKTSDFYQCKNTEVYKKKYSGFKIANSSFNLVRGPTGSGKSLIIKNIFANELYKEIHSENLLNNPFNISIIKSLPKNLPSDILLIDANLTRFTGRSSVGSLTDLSNVVRKYYSNLEISKIMGLQTGHFSSNSKLGQCETCGGSGFELIEMPYLDDIKMKCDDCEGKGLKLEFAEITDGEQTIFEALANPMGLILDRIPLTPKFKSIYEYFKKLNLDYLSLDRKVGSLSGGEKQRIYLLSKLIGNKKNQVIILENLSFGLSSLEIHKVGQFIKDLSLLGSTIILLDHNKEFLFFADYEISFNSQGKIETSFLG